MVFVVLIFTILIFVGSSMIFASEVKNKILPPSIAPVFFLQGSDYDMGYQYGYQAAEYISVFKDNVWANMLRWGYTKEEVESRLKAFEYYNQKYFPEVSENLRGMVDGATDAGYPMTYSDVLLIQCEWDVGVGDKPETVYPPVEEIEYPPRGCSNFAAWGSATTHGQIVGGTSADAGEFRAQGVICAFPDTGNDFISSAEIGLWAWNFVVNSKGLLSLITWTPTEARSIDNAYGLDSMLVLYRIARFANNAKEARELLLKLPLTIGQNYLFVDSEDASVTETTAALQYTRKPGDFGEKDFLVNTNFRLIPEMDVAQPGCNLGRDRYDQLFNYLAKNQGHVDIEFAKMMYRNPPVAAPGTGAVQLASITNENIVCYICTGAASKEGGMEVPRIAPTHSFYELELKDTPEKVTEAARKTAITYLKQSMTELNKIDYTHPGFVALNKLLYQAKIEYYAGKNAHDNALLTSGNEALYN